MPDQHSSEQQGYVVTERQQQAIERERRHAPRNYAPLPIVLERGEGAWVWDIDGRRYLDTLAALSSANFGHAHPEFTRVAHEQLDRVTIVTRAVHAGTVAPFLEALAALAGKDYVLPVNTGAEANEAAVKVARKWGYRVKGVAADRAKIIGARGNFHGRTTTLVSLSDDPLARDDYGPLTPGFELVDYGDIEGLRAAIDQDTVAVILEPIQGEAGIIVPPAGYLQQVRELTREHNVLLIVDEVQSGLGRTGATFRHQAEGIEADLITVGKSLGAGIVPISAVIGDEAVLGVLEPGTHGSTFGGNPLATAIGKAVVDALATGEYQERSRLLGERLHAGLRDLLGHGLTEVRGVGLWAGVDIDPAYGTAKEVVLDLLGRGILSKDTRGITIRFAPPFVVTEDEIDLLVRTLGETLAARRPVAAVLA